MGGFLGVKVVSVDGILSENTQNLEDSGGRFRAVLRHNFNFWFEESEEAAGTFVADRAQEVELLEQFNDSFDGRFVRFFDEFQNDALLAVIVRVVLNCGGALFSCQNALQLFFRDVTQLQDRENQVEDLRHEGSQVHSDFVENRFQIVQKSLQFLKLNTGQFFHDFS